MTVLYCPFDESASSGVDTSRDWSRPDILFESRAGHPARAEYDADLANVYMSCFRMSPGAVLDHFATLQKATLPVSAGQIVLFYREDGAAGVRIRHLVQGRPMGLLTFSMESGEDEKNVNLSWISCQKHQTGWGREMVQKLADLARMEGAKGITLRASQANGAYSWARTGFMPRQACWDRLRQEINSLVEALPEDFVLTEKDRDAIMCATAAADPRAIWQLADLRTDIDGMSLGAHLLCGRDWYGYLDFTAGDQMARLGLGAGGGPGAGIVEPGPGRDGAIRQEPSFTPR